MTAATASFLSPQWYRVAYLKPRLRAGVRVSRHTVRGQVWYVLTDPISRKHHRLDGRAYALISSCDGDLTIDDIWARRVDTAGDDAPTQNEAMEVFAQAFAANLLSGDVAADARAQMRAQRRSQQRQQRLALNPLSFKLPLWNPERFVDAHIGALRWVFSVPCFMAITVAMVLGLMLWVLNLDALARATAGVGSQGRVLILMWLAYPVIKLLHELAHAFAVKAFGGEVHEMGVAMLLLTPMPYVDASSATAFPNKHHRVIVGAAGIAVEWLLASFALVLWLALEPGLLRDLALAITLVGGVSTLLINGNPLVRFDGYHVFCDAMELPNLGQRSAAWWGRLLRRVLLGHTHAHAPAMDSHASGRERAWLAAYAPLSWVYRSLMTLVLALAVAEWHAGAGLVVLGLALWWMVVAPLLTALRGLAQAAPGDRARGRAWMVGAGGAMLLLLLAFVAPMPHRTVAPGVVWLPDDAIVRAGTSGNVAQWLVQDGDMVEPGTPLLRLQNDPLRQALRKAEAELEQQRIEHLMWIESDMLRSAQAGDRVKALDSERARLAAEVASLDLRAATRGTVAIESRRLVQGRWVAHGDVAAYVMPQGAPLVRALVSNDTIHQVRANHDTIAVSLSHETGGDSVAGEWLRGVPRATTQLMTAALSTAAGGPIAVDPADPQHRVALEPRFEVDVRLPASVKAHVGARAWVTFDHGHATLAALSLGFVRRAFLRHFAT